MTREDVISGLKFTVDMFLFDPSTGERYTEPRNDMDKTTVDACRGAIELLKQEPCEDCISRADAEALFRNARNRLNPSDYKTADEFNTRDLMLLNAEQLIHMLPPVTPKQKTGHWIPDDTICEDTLYRCSNCDNVYYSDYGDVKDMGYNYCPNCGAKMESEG